MELISNRAHTNGRETSLTDYTGCQEVIPAELKPAVDRCVKRYKSYENFLAKLGIDKAQTLVANYQDQLICVPDDGKGHVLVPTIEIACKAFGFERIQAWLMTYIINANAFLLGSNTEKKMTPSQIEEAASLIIQNYGRGIFVTEIPVIFARIKGGRYGKVYGCIDGGMILNCFELYLEQRTVEKAQIYRQMEKERIARRELEESKLPRMSLEEWQQTMQYQELKMEGKVENIEAFMKRFDLQVITDGKSQS